MLFIVSMMSSCSVGPQTTGMRGRQQQPVTEGLLRRAPGEVWHSALASLFHETVHLYYRFRDFGHA